MTASMPISCIGRLVPAPSATSPSRAVGVTATTTTRWAQVASTASPSSPGKGTASPSGNSLMVCPYLLSFDGGRCVFAGPAASDSGCLPNQLKRRTEPNPVRLLWTCSFAIITVYRPPTDPDTLGAERMSRG